MNDTKGHWDRTHSHLPRPGSTWDPKQDSRPAFGLYAPGDYMVTCHKCRQHFIGDKRALHCADCAYSEPLKPEQESTPLAKNFTQAELVEEAKQWIRTKYPATEHDDDLRMQRLGILIDFVTDLIPNDK